MEKEKGLNYVNFTISMIAVIIITIVFYFALQRMQLITLSDIVKNYMEIAEDYVLAVNADVEVDGKTKKEDRYHIILVPSASNNTTSISSSENEQLLSVTSNYITQIKKLFDLNSNNVPQSGDLKNLNCSRFHIKKLVIYEAIYSNEAVGCQHIYDTVAGFIKYEIMLSNNAVNSISKTIINGSTTVAASGGKLFSIKSTTIFAEAEFDISVFYKGFGKGNVTSSNINRSNVSSVSNSISTTYTVKETAWMRIWGKEKN